MFECECLSLVLIATFTGGIATICWKPGLLYITFIHLPLRLLIFMEDGPLGAVFFFVFVEDCCIQNYVDWAIMVEIGKKGSKEGVVHSITYYFDNR